MQTPWVENAMELKLFNTRNVSSEYVWQKLYYYYGYKWQICEKVCYCTLPLCDDNRAALLFFYIT